MNVWYFQQDKTIKCLSGPNYPDSSLLFYSVVGHSEPVIIINDSWRPWDQPMTVCISDVHCYFDAFIAVSTGMFIIIFIVISNIWSFFSLELLILQEVFCFKNVHSNFYVTCKVLQNQSFTFELRLWNGSFDNNSSWKLSPVPLQCNQLDPG